MLIDSIKMKMSETFKVNWLKKFCFFMFIIHTTCPNLYCEVIFQDNFDYEWTPVVSEVGQIYPCKKDIGGSCTTLTDYPISAEPLGSRNNSNSWNGYRSSSPSNYKVSIESGIGINSSGALKITYPPGSGVSGEASLIKWLGWPGYNEIYIRWYFKFKDSGDDRWCWGDGTSDSFNFYKLGRFYQGVDLNSLKDVPHYVGDQYYVHVSNYPSYVIPDWNNSSSYGERSILPLWWPTCQNNQNTGGYGSCELWRHIYKYHWPTLNMNAAIAPNDGTSAYVCGPIYTTDENASKAGEFKNPQTWHSIEMHLKLRELSESGSVVNATYVSDWSFKAAGDHTSTFTSGVLVKCNYTGQYDGVNAPVLHEVSSSSYNPGTNETTVTLVEQSSASSTSPHLTNSITTVVKVVESSPGIIEAWIDGVSIGNYGACGSNVINSNALQNSTLEGGFSYIILNDNTQMTRNHQITMYIDKLVISTTYVGPLPPKANPAFQ